MVAWRMFLSNQRVSVPSSSVANPVHTESSAVDGQSVIGRSLVIKGEITGTESIYVEGTVEGSIVLSGNRVTVGLSGRVAADIVAEDIVVMGELIGNCDASDHVYVRREGSICGNIVAAAISIEEGAHLTGTIEIRRESKTVSKAPEPMTSRQESTEFELAELVHAG